ncbi:MAG: hypothetical protein Q8S31_04560 [Alphaproteobacteria bacterium]|nr:hypothetical protein [Alphaproteobacteria bacterium]
MKRSIFLVFLFLASPVMASGSNFYYKLACSIMRNYVKPYGANIPFDYFLNLHYASQGGHKKARDKLKDSAQHYVKYPNLFLGYPKKERIGIIHILFKYLPKE